MSVAATARAEKPEVRGPKRARYGIVREMKTLWPMLILLLLANAASAQPKPASATNVIEFESVDEWLNDNIDPDVLRALSQLDQDRVRRLFSELQQAIAGTNIYQLGTLRETATQLAPILQKFDETAPYGAWLQAQLDYLEASQELERAAEAAKPKPGVELSPGMAAKFERQVWARQVNKRPWPPLAQNYVPKLKAVFVAERMPPELVWVAEVESSFNPSARSPAGAAGMFQLMPQTARDEHLSLWPWDERYRPEESARAAARYLRALHAHYGDWPLALAAYNTGEGRVDKLLKQKNARTFEAIARRLPAETQMYVPRVEATIREREGRDLSDLKIPKT